MPFTELHLSEKGMVCKELRKGQRDRIVERDQSGESSKRISKALKTVIMEWRRNGTTGILSRTGQREKKTVREAVHVQIIGLKMVCEVFSFLFTSQGCVDLSTVYFY